jgi:N-acetylglucosaminyl-diphospho-decaprenol L-rhamnosyltransferase
MPAADLKRLPDWLVLAQEEWDEVERRNQLLMRALAERHPRSRILFAEIPLRPRELGRWRLPRLRQVAPNIWTVRAIRPLPDRFGRVSDRIEAAQVRRAMRRLAIEQPLVWTQDPRVATLVDLLPLGDVVYDLTDDWAAFESDPERRALVQSRIESLGRRAAAVFACSRPLEQGARRWAQDVTYLPNGVDPPDRASTAPAAQVAALPGPRLGYVGTLHSSRLDVALLAEAAELRPAWSFVLIGPDLLDRRDRSQLMGLPNVHYLGALPHAEVRRHLAALDVGLVAHRVDDFTRSLDPLKVYEYLATGLPVVSTPLGNTPELHEHVTEAASAVEFVERAEALVAEDNDARSQARRDAVNASTWAARARVVEQTLGILPEGEEGGPDVSAAVVSFNTRALLERCLEGLQRQDGVSLETIVVDNGSTDGSVEMVRDRFPSVQIIELGENAGFARANNVAFERCRGEFVLLLNSDAFIPQDGLAELVAAAWRHPDAAAVGPRLLNEDGSLQRSAWPFPAAWRILLEAFGVHRPLRRLGLVEDLGIWGHNEERAVDFLIGACLLLRRTALAEVGGFDEEFWLYGEEADLERRMTARGWRVVFTPAIEVTHVGGASSGVSAVRLRHFYSGQMRFLRKHGGRFSWPVARFALLAGSLLRRRWVPARVALEVRAGRSR